VDVEITPEPTEAEREAILAALRRELEDGQPPAPWRRAALGLSEDDDQAAALPRQSRGAARA
jgi:hypothetical protein